SPCVVCAVAMSPEGLRPAACVRRYLIPRLTPEGSSGWHWLLVSQCLQYVSRTHPLTDTARQFMQAAGRKPSGRPRAVFADEMSAEGLRRSAYMSGEAPCVSGRERRGVHSRMGRPLAQRLGPIASLGYYGDTVRRGFRRE